ncbi:MAG TPA: ABC transporter permease, partial [Clostridia bacterium]|nr:ABC transporter permease [Clostridia bacterium]
HAGALMRQIMMEAPLEAARLNPMLEEGFRLEMGVNYKFGDTVLPAWGSVLILLATTALFYALAILNISRKRKE